MSAKKNKYCFMIGVLDSYTHQNIVLVKNLSSQEASIVLSEFRKKFGGD